RPASELVTATRSPKRSSAARASSAASPVPPRIRRRKGGAALATGASPAGLSDEGPRPIEDRDVDSDGAGECCQRHLARLGGDPPDGARAVLRPGERENLAGAARALRGRNGRCRRSERGERGGKTLGVEPAARGMEIELTGRQLGELAE